jgi:ubiquinone biosynthesis protein
VALLDFGITGRLDPNRRIALLRSLMGGMRNDVMSQLEGLRDLGAFAPGADLDALASFHAEGLQLDPATVDAEALVAQMRDTMRVLLDQGARLPKELMLFLKGMVFLDGAMALLAPDGDLLAEMTHVIEYLGERHGEQIASEIGLEMSSVQLDMSGALASMGLSGEDLTPNELRRQRQAMRTKMQGLRKRR